MRPIGACAKWALSLSLSSWRVRLPHASAKWRLLSVPREGPNPSPSYLKKFWNTRNILGVEHLIISKERNRKFLGDRTFICYCTYCTYCTYCKYCKYPHLPALMHLFFPYQARSLEIKGDYCSESICDFELSWVSLASPTFLPHAGTHGSG